MLGYLVISLENVEVIKEYIDVDLIIKFKNFFILKGIINKVKRLIYVIGIFYSYVIIYYWVIVLFGCELFFN